MARDVSDETPIGSRDELVAWIEAGIKEPTEFRIGTEHEKIPFYLGSTDPVPFVGQGGRGGIEALLTAKPALALTHAGENRRFVDMADGDKRTMITGASNTVMGVVLLVVGAISSAISVLGPQAALLFLAVVGYAGVVGEAA